MSSPQSASTASGLDWSAANQAYLDLALQGMRLRLQRRVRWLRQQWKTDPLQGHPDVISDQQADGLLVGEDWSAEHHFYATDETAATISQALRDTEQRLARLSASFQETGIPPAPLLLAKVCGLSVFDQQVLLLCFAPEIDPAFAELYAYVQDHPSRRYATPYLALSLFGEDEKTRRLAPNSFLPDAPLRSFALLSFEAGPFPGTALMARPLHLATRIADYLRGVNRLDTRVADLLQPVPDTPLASSHHDLADRLVQRLKAKPPVLHTFNLVGAAGVGKQTVARAVCARLGMQLTRVALNHLPASGPEQRQMFRRMQRDAVLSHLAYYIDAAALDEAEKCSEAATRALIDRLPAMVFVGSEDRWQAERQLPIADVPKPTPAEQQVLWQHALAGIKHAVGDRIAKVVQQFDFGPRAVAQAVETARHLAQLRNGDQDPVLTAEDLWQACRAQCGPRLDQLGQRINSNYTWEDIVLSDDLFEQLRELAAQVAHRYKVYEQWGFGASLSRGRGISALFAGPSGTGKTMAAEVLANGLALDLYRIDLSGVVSKYIGETEKNLKQVFDAAEQSGAILFFDEADALFGKRTEVKDSHDRYANIEVNYLLQRMEDYRGLAILATNRKSALDRAFLRRLRFLMDFPFPDADSRRRIWQKIFPAGAPLDRLDYTELARLEVSGGNIRNIALNAAFLAAEDNQPITMAHLGKAARREYIKIDKMITPADFGTYYQPVNHNKPAQNI